MSGVPLVEKPKYNYSNPSAAHYDVTYLSTSPTGSLIYQTDGTYVPPYDNNYTWHVTPLDGLWHGNSKYVLHVTGVGKNNKIRIRIPFDQINASISCHPGSGSIVTADCTTITGNFSDPDSAGPYRIDAHFKDNPYTNTLTVFTDASNNFTINVPAGRKYPTATSVWVDSKQSA